MRFRLGLIVGAGAGYYFGTAAGRERHDQINRAIGKITGSDAYEAATEKLAEAAKQVVDVTVDKAKDVVEEHRPGNGHAPLGPTYSPSR